MSLILIDENIYGIILDIRYATTNNFLEKEIYPNSKCYLHPEALSALNLAIKYASQLGLEFRIFDGFRPIEAQRKLWETLPDPNYISNPKNGKLPHCRGIALDLTLTDVNGNDLDMGTEFDAFTKKSYHGSKDLTNTQLKNRLILSGIMLLSGWEHNPNEWWHYQLPNFENYEVLGENDL